MIVVNKVARATVNDHGIYGFFGEYRFLSNFEPAEFMLDGILWTTSEHAYMAGKTDSIQIKQHIAALKNPKEAKKYGQTVPLRQDWDVVKPYVMLDAVFAKFNQNEHLADKLLATGDKYLEETNYWNDRYWGVCGGQGLNMLGKTLMQVRDHIRKNKPTEVVDLDKRFLV